MSTHLRFLDRRKHHPFDEESRPGNGDRVFPPALLRWFGLAWILKEDDSPLNRGFLPMFDFLQQPEKDFP